MAQPDIRGIGDGAYCIATHVLRLQRKRVDFPTVPLINIGRVLFSLQSFIWLFQSRAGITAMRFAPDGTWTFPPPVSLILYFHIDSSLESST